jgi:peroxiredoxin
MTLDSLRLPIALLALSLGLAAQPAAARPQIGQPAPGFAVADTAGRTWTLADAAGKRLILEWTNHDCPYVKKHYGSGNLQALQQEATAQGWLWLSVISSAPGKQGHVTPAEADRLTRERQAAPTAVLLDTDGAMGRAYGAQTTPHLFAIDTDGRLIYMGGIDDRATTDQADIATATNYIRAALTDLAAGRPVSTPLTRPYGCSVKY